MIIWNKQNVDSKYTEYWSEIHNVDMKYLHRMFIWNKKIVNLYTEWRMLIRNTVLSMLVWNTQNVDMKYTHNRMLISHKQNVVLIHKILIRYTQLITKSTFQKEPNNVDLKSTEWTNWSWIDDKYSRTLLSLPCYQGQWQCMTVWGCRGWWRRSSRELTRTLGTPGSSGPGPAHSYTIIQSIRGIQSLWKLFLRSIKNPIKSLKLKFFFSLIIQWTLLN